MTNISFSDSNKPDLWHLYRHELYKNRKQTFYQLIVLGPLFVSLLVIVIMTLLKLGATTSPVMPTTNYVYSPYDLGTEGSFALSSNWILNQLGTIYSFVIIVACALNTGNEYRWNTVKMLAIRQPRRASLALAKCMFAFTLAGIIFLILLIIWIIFGFFLKFFFTAPLELTSQDLENVGKGLKFFALTSLYNFIITLLVVALTIQFKSTIAGVLGFLFYRGFDSIITTIGADVLNRPSGTSAPVDWIKPIWELASWINPYLLTSSINRLAMAEPVQISDSNQAYPAFNLPVVWSTPEWWAWLIVIIYAISFTLLTVLVFVQQDITE